MEIRISQQLELFAQAVLLGVAAALVYDLLRPARLRLPRATALLDGAYSLGAGGAVFFFTLRRAQGILRGYVVLGALGGAVLFFCLLSAQLRPLWEFWADVLALFLRLLRLPLRKTVIFCKKMFTRGKYLFYFVGKCYTIVETGSKALHGRGGTRCGKRDQ